MYNNYIANFISIYEVGLYIYQGSNYEALSR